MWISTFESAIAGEPAPGIDPFGAFVAATRREASIAPSCVAARGTTAGLIKRAFATPDFGTLGFVALGIAGGSVAGGSAGSGTGTVLSGGAAVTSGPVEG